LREGKRRAEDDDTPNNSMDVRAKQRLCLLACLFTFGGLGGGFAPRHLSRWAASLEIETNNFYGKTNLTTIFVL